MKVLHYEVLTAFCYGSTSLDMISRSGFVAVLGENIFLIHLFSNIHSIYSFLNKKCMSLHNVCPYKMYVPTKCMSLQNNTQNCTQNKNNKQFSRVSLSAMYPNYMLQTVTHKYRFIYRGYMIIL